MRNYFWLAILLSLVSRVNASAIAGTNPPQNWAQWPDVPSYPRLVLISRTASYYAPDLAANYFYYDGTYWVYQGDEWYQGAWYNGPWAKVNPLRVPLSILQIPLLYYNNAPAYFSGGASNAPPRWDVHWGPAWARYRGVWEAPMRGAVAILAPTPDYQGHYEGAQYPDAAQQIALRTHYFPYRAHEPVTEAAAHGAPSAPASAQVFGLGTTADSGVGSPR